MRVKRLIKELKTTQDEVAERAAKLGSKLTRNDVNKVCTGLNKASTEKIRGGLSLGFGVSRTDMSDYLDGRLDVRDLMRRRIRPTSLVEAISGKPTELTFGSLDGWDEAEREAIEMAAVGESELRRVDFIGARNWAAFGVPPKVTPRFVTTVAWLWKQCATEEQRREATALAPPERPSGPYKAVK